MLGLKKKVEELLRERNVSRAEMVKAKRENESMSAQLKTHSSNAIASQASDADTLLNLQKMIQSLEESKGQLEEEMDHMDEKLKFSEVKISQLEGEVEVHSGPNAAEAAETLLNLQEMVASLEESKAQMKEDMDLNDEHLTISEDNISQLDNEVQMLRDENEELVRENLAAIADLEGKLRQKDEEGAASLSLEGEDAAQDAIEENEFLQERIASLGEANAGLTSKLEELQRQVEEFECAKQVSSETVNDRSLALVDSLHSAGTGIASQDLATLETTINLLEESKMELEEEMLEAADAIAMLEDELDNKDVQVKELLKKLTVLQQQFSQADKCKTALALQHAKLSAQNDDLDTQIKVHGIEMKVASEEIENLKAMKSIAEDEEEEHLFIKSEHIQEIDLLKQILDDLKRKGNSQVLYLEQQVYQLEEAKKHMEENLDESADAIVMLREALEELEGDKMASKEQITELVSSMERLKNVESESKKWQSEHQVSVNTIAALQKMISSLEATGEDLEEELNASALEVSDLKDQLRFKSTMSEVLQLENKLKRAEDSNASLSKRIADLTETHEEMKDEVNDLGKKLSSAKSAMRQSVASSASLALIPSDPGLSSDVDMSNPVAACDALISELRNQIKAIVSARDAAFEHADNACSNVSSSISSGEVTIPPVRSVETTRTVEDLVSPLDDSTATKTVELPSEDEKSVKTKKSIAQSNAGSRGSSLLEAAKKLCNQLDEKRSVAAEKVSNSAQTNQPPAASNKYKRAAMPREEDIIKNVVDQDDDKVSAKEVKVEPAKGTIEKPIAKSEEKKKEDSSRESRSKPRLDIDQLTSIYFEKCGMSVSRFSDMSSEASSFRRRTVEAPTDTVTKKVKICRNGVFMGTYEGDLNAESQRHGFGVLLCDNGNSYEGEWKKDKRDGLGIARYSSGDVYDGQWQRGKREGHGVMYIEAGDTYIGSWNNGLKHGAGTYHWADGEVDVSWYQEDRRVGEGVRWNASRSTAFQLIRGTKKEELSLDEAYVTAEKLGLNLEKFSSGAP